MTDFELGLRLLNFSYINYLTSSIVISQTFYIFTLDFQDYEMRY